MGESQIFPLSQPLHKCYYTPMPYNFLARIQKSEPVPGIKTVVLTLIRDEDAVELAEGDEFVTVQMVVDPFK